MRTKGIYVGAMKVRCNIRFYRIDKRSHIKPKLRYFIFDISQRMCDAGYCAGGHRTTLVQVATTHVLTQEVYVPSLFFD